MPSLAPSPVGAASPRWAAEYRGFWDLPEDFQVEAPTPTVQAWEAEPGKLTPEESADEFLASSEVARADPPRGAGKPLERSTLAALLDEKLSRREVHAIQSGHKDVERFDNWASVLQERVDYEDPIVLPVGEGLNVVRRRSDGELVIRCDCGHDFCRHDRNWKLEAAVRIRADTESMAEIYPGMAAGDPDWLVASAVRAKRERAPSDRRSRRRC